MVKKNNSNSAAERKAAERRAAQEAAGNAPKIEKKEKKKQEPKQGAIGKLFTYLFTFIRQLIGGWICSTRFVSLLCFIFGLVGRYSGFIDELMEGLNGYVHSYFYCPAIILAVSSVSLTALKWEHVGVLSVIFTKVCSAGVMAAMIIQEQVQDLAESPNLKYKPEDFAYLSLACAALSFGVSAVDYRMNGSMKMVLLRAMGCAAPACLLAVYNIVPQPMLAAKTGLMCSFTLAVGIVDFYVTELCTHIHAWPYVGCVVHGVAMSALSTYFTCLRFNRSPDSWFSFSSLVPAGPYLCVFTLSCHLIHWTCEKIFGEGRQNAKYTVGMAVVAWSVVALPPMFGWQGLISRETMDAPQDMAHIAVDYVKKAIGW